MTEPEWQELGETLAAEFSDDLAQQAILELLETQARGTSVTNPLHWCRMRAKSRRINASKREQVEREGKRTLAALGLPYDSRSVTEQATERKRRERRRRRAAERAA